jgi:hypothetical protein
MSVRCVACIVWCVSCADVWPVRLPSTHSLCTPITSVCATLWHAIGKPVRAGSEPHPFLLPFASSHSVCAVAVACAAFTYFQSVPHWLSLIPEQTRPIDVYAKRKSEEWMARWQALGKTLSGVQAQAELTHSYAVLDAFDLLLNWNGFASMSAHTLNQAIEMLTQAHTACSDRWDVVDTCSSYLYLAAALRVKDCFEESSKCLQLLFAESKALEASARAKAAGILPLAYYELVSCSLSSCFVFVCACVDSSPPFAGLVRLRLGCPQRS